MTRPLSKQQFIRFVDSLYMAKNPRATVSEDAAGYFVKIANSCETRGRYDIHVFGPTGKVAGRNNVDSLGIWKVAAILYDAVTEDIDTDEEVPEDYFQSEHWKAEVELDRRDIDAELRAHEEYMNDEARNADEKQHMPED